MNAQEAIEELRDEAILCRHDDLPTIANGWDEIADLIQALQSDNTKLWEHVDRLYKVLDIALHDLVTSNNLLVTDRPDLVDLDIVVQTRNGRVTTMEDISWITNHKDSIKALEDAMKGGVK